MIAARYTRPVLLRLMKENNLFNIINKLKIWYQKRIAKYLLNELREFPDIILAGGAPRDWLLGKPATDLDFYSNVAEVDAFLDALHRLGITPTRQNEIRLAGSYVTRYLSCIVDFKYRGIKCQMMFITVPTKQVIHEFPLSISQIYLDRFGKTEASYIFKDCLLRNQIRVTTSQYESVEDYINKIRNKYPEAMFVNPYNKGE